MCMSCCQKRFTFNIACGTVASNSHRVIREAIMGKNLLFGNSFINGGTSVSVDIADQ